MGSFYRKAAAAAIPIAKKAVAPPSAVLDSALDWINTGGHAAGSLNRSGFLTEEILGISQPSDATAPKKIIQPETGA
jgi:hypothetical protein